MNVSKLNMTIAAGVFALTTASVFSGTAIADTKIANVSDCEFEGGSMVNVKSSDYCLVQIRPEEYSGAEYDGNQLGVVDCPGSKLNDGAFCMYPVSVAKSGNGGPAGYVKSAPIASETGQATIVQQVTDLAKEEAEKMAKKEAEKAAKKKAKKALGKLF